jgi:hypothetical protein
VDADLLESLVAGLIGGFPALGADIATGALVSFMGVPVLLGNRSQDFRKCVVNSIHRRIESIRAEVQLTSQHVAVSLGADRSPLALGRCDHTLPGNFF